MTSEMIGNGFAMTRFKISFLFGFFIMYGVKFCKIIQPFCEKVKTAPLARSLLILFKLFQKLRKLPSCILFRSDSSLSYSPIS